MNPDQVFILLATYNRAHLVTETLQSIQNQTYKDWQCIIVDDFSSDDTPKVVKEFIADDPRFNFYIKTEPYAKGLSGSRNYGLDLAQQQGAKFIQFFDDDDIMHPNKLELQINEFLKKQELDVVLCKYEGFTRDQDPLKIEPYSDIPIKSKNLAEDFLFNKVRINSAGPLFKIHLFKDEKFDESLPYGEERELFLRIFFKYLPKHSAVEEYLFFYRHHSISITASKANELEKIGTNVILSHRLWDFLYEHDLLNKKVAGYLLRQFLLQNHNKQYIGKVKNFTCERKLGAFQAFKFRTIINFHQIYTRIIYKVMLK